MNRNHYALLIICLLMLCLCGDCPAKIRDQQPSTASADEAKKDDTDNVDKIDRNLRFAVFDDREFIDRITIIKQQMDEIKTELAPLLKEFSEVECIYDKYYREEVEGTPETLRHYFELLQKYHHEVQVKLTQIHSLYEVRYREKVAPLMAKLPNALEQYRQIHNIDILLNINLSYERPIYVDPRLYILDITNDFIDSFNQDRIGALK